MRDEVNCRQLHALLEYNAQSCKNPTNLQTEFGGKLWPKNEEGFVDSAPVYPSAGKVGIN